MCKFESALAVFSDIIFGFYSWEKKDHIIKDNTTLNAVTPSVHNMVAHTSKIFQQML